MTKVNMQEAKTHFARLIERALAGEEIVVAKHGKALVRLVPVAKPSGRRPVGLDAQIGLSADFFEESLRPLGQDELELWEQGSVVPPSAPESAKESAK